MSTHATDLPAFKTDSDTDYGALLRWAATVASSPVIDELAPVLLASTPARSWVPLPAPGGWDAWLIGWPGGSDTGWHDHQGAAGVFYVARGVLTEFSVADRAPSGLYAVGTPVAAWSEVRTRRVDTGRGRAFGANHIHHVVNEFDQPAYSIHVYAPRLRAMTRYEWQDDALVLTGTDRAGSW
jgi:hypothetical protein